MERRAERGVLSGRSRDALCRRSVSDEAQRTVGPSQSELVMRRRWQLGLPHNSPSVHSAELAPEHRPLQSVQPAAAPGGWSLWAPVDGCPPSLAAAWGLARPAAAAEAGSSAERTRVTLPAGPARIGVRLPPGTTLHLDVRPTPDGRAATFQLSPRPLAVSLPGGLLIT